MKIQQQNSYNPSMKALYFTKSFLTHTSCRPAAINERITNLGVIYREDKSAKLTPIMREAFAENHFIGSLAQKFDVFVQYVGEKLKSDKFSSTAAIYVTRKENGSVLSEGYLFSSEDKYTPEGARIRLLENISAQRYTHKDTETLGKSL